MAAWALSLIVLVGAVAVPSFLGDLGCEYPGSDSRYGEAQWQWFPPGVGCRYGEQTERPTYIVSVALVMSVAIPAVAFIYGRKRRQSRHGANQRWA